MSIASLAVGVVVGNVMGVVLMCLMVTGKRADADMERIRLQRPDCKKQIRFKDSDNRTVFLIPDGESIELTAPNGEKQTGICRYIDEDIACINGSEWNMQDFARQMEQRGIVYAPLS